MTDDVDTKSSGANAINSVDGDVAATPKITHAMEDYLKVAYRLQQEGGPVSTQRLADELGISGPSVTNMVKRLHDLQLVSHTRYHGMELTASGQRIALEVLRHHRLLELYLKESLGYDWDQVHDEAERLEHHVSKELEARMDSFLGFPTVDPHGDPIPSREGVIASVPATRLVDLDPGDSARVSRVSDRDPDQLRYLGEMGLYPGVEISVEEKLPFDGPIRIAIGDDTHIIGRTLASAVNVDSVERKGES
jgi:DtxR family transcriptional regulator, Mn-dependent transcriptional regulator